MMRKMLWVFMAGMLLPRSAHAYLDPGNGSMMVQLLLAGAAGVMVALKMFWRRILALFKRSKPEGPENRSPSA
jgi:hypothetical protein